MAKKRNYLEGILKVLKDAKEPLSVREITDKLLQNKLVIPKGKTPENTVYSIIHYYIRECEKKKIKPKIEKVYKGYYKYKNR